MPVSEVPHDARGVGELVAAKTKEDVVSMAIAAAVRLVPVHSASNNCEYALKVAYLDLKVTPNKHTRQS